MQDVICHRTYVHVLAMLLMLTADSDSAMSSVVALLPDRIIGKDEVVVVRPCDVGWDDDGNCYVLNCGSLDVSVLDQDWRLVRTIGRVGEGPGELNRPISIKVDHQRLIIRQISTTLEYTLGGEFVGMAQEGELSLTHDVGGLEVALSMQAGVRSARWTDPGGNIVECELPGRGNSAWTLLEASPQRRQEAFLLVDSHDGVAWSLSADGTTGDVIDLGLGRGQEWSGGGKSVVSDICFDPDRGYWVIHYPEIGKPGYLYELTHDFQQVQRWSLEDMFVGQVYVTPANKLLLINGHGSVMYVLNKPS